MSYRNATHKTTDINDPGLLTRAGPVPNERVEDSEASSEHTSGVLGLETVWDGEDELLQRDDAGGVATLGASAAGQQVPSGCSPI
jgi:hypothetical protein